MKCEIRLVGAGNGYHLEKTDDLYALAQEFGAERIELYHDGQLVDRWEVTEQ